MTSVARTSSSKSQQDAKLAAFKAEKLAKKHARAEELHRQFPALYAKPPAFGSKISDDRMAPSVKILLEKYPVAVTAAVNDENTIANGADKSKKGKSKSLITKIFGSKKGKAQAPAKRDVLSPMKNSANIAMGDAPEKENEAAPGAPDAEASSAASADEEQVQDVLDYLLDEKQVTPAVYRRMSCERLTLAGIQHRLSMMPTAGVAPDTMVLDAVQQYIAKVLSSWDEDIASYLASSVTSSNRTSVEAAPCDDKTAASEENRAKMESAPMQPVGKLEAAPIDDDAERTEIPGKSRSPSKVRFGELPAHAVSGLGAGGGGGSTSARPTLSVETGNGAGAAGEGGGSSPLRGAGGGDGGEENEDLFGNDDDDEGATAAEDENDPSVQSNLLRKCLDWYLRQGSVALDVSSYMIRKADNQGTPRGDDVGEDGIDGKEYVAYEVRMNGAGGISADAKGFKMMILQRYSSFQRLYDRLRKALNEENIKNIAGGSAAVSTYQAAMTHNRAFFDAMKANSYVISNTDSAGALRSKRGRWQLFLPPLPPKRILTSFGRWKDPAFLDSRRDMLRSWLQAVLPLQAYQTPTAAASPEKAGAGDIGSPSKRAGDNKIRQAFRSFLLPDHCL